MKCSFCNKDEKEVHRLIASDDKITICDSCVLACVETLVYPDVEEINIQSDDETTEEDANAQKNSGC